jgi:alpha-tubulin suppressor-like RCC1 family protein
VWLWGRNQFGQLGDNTTTNKSSPVQTIAGGTNWKQVAAGAAHSSAIKTDGTLWTWGQNTDGQLGDNTTTNKSSPVQTIAASTNWKQVSCNGMHTTAIKTDGTLWTWGQGINAQLGNGVSSSRSSPAQTASSTSNWILVSAGAYHTAAIREDFY